MATEDPIAPTATAEPVTVAAVAVKPDEKPKKVKKAPAKAKPRNPSSHPPYLEMIKEAVVTLKERTGSSQYAITKFIEENQKNLPANFKKLLLTQLKKFVAAGKLVKVKASYKLPAARAPAAGAPAKKKPVSKPKTVKKLTPAKKKTVAKPNPAPKVKAAAKPKPAVKAKAVAKPKAAATKAKPKAKSPAKVARTSTRSTPGKKALKPAVKKVAAVKPALKKAAVKSLKPKAAIAKKASGTKKVKK